MRLGGALAIAAIVVGSWDAAAQKALQRDRRQTLIVAGRGAGGYGPC